MSKPVVLLAFANDREEGSRYLRLPEERRQVLDALAHAKQSGICDVEAVPNATVVELLNAFRTRRDQIAVFHFSGHAGSYELLFENAVGGPVSTEAAGLADFLAQQRGLELIVLNACATEGHVRRLLAAGVPAVIATSRAVEDEIALDFARELWRGIGGGAGVRRAFEEASAAVRMQRLPQRSADGTRRDILPADFLTEGIKADGLVGDSGWPWGLFVRDGAESVEQWTLAGAAGDPLFGLPSLPDRALPERPYRALQPFGREHAALFFGREAETRTLYDRVTAVDGPQITLLYGQTGVGKSSLLDAGLLPRLEGSHVVRYARRDHARGLLGTLADLLGVGDSVDSASDDASDAADRARASAALGAAWVRQETTATRPLIVVIDQVEEAFTRADGVAGGAPGGEVRAAAREIDTFALTAAAVFAPVSGGDARMRPRGHLVLGFRKEWLAEVDGALAAHRVSRGKQFLGRLTRAGVAAAVAGPTRTPAFRAQYGLTIEDGLPELIADDLLADRESHVAPVLQILLARLWDRVVAHQPSAPRFDGLLYYEARKEGLLLDDFLDQRLAELAAWHPPAVATGLALDFLAFHTTQLGTARERSTAESSAAYPQLSTEPIYGLPSRCTELYLLTERSGEVANDGGTRLAHDTLAPLVRRRVELSDAPGQRAMRTLKARAADWADGRTGVPLDEADLVSVERGVGGMRAWSADEARLVAASRAARDSRRRERRFARTAGVVLVGLVVVFGLVGLYTSKQAIERAAWAEAALLIMRSGELLGDAPDLALLAAVAALERRPTAQARGALLAAGRASRGLVMVLPAAPVAQFTADGDYLTYDGRTAVRWHLRGLTPADTLALTGFSGLDSAVAAQIAPDGQSVAALLPDRFGRPAKVVVQIGASRPIVLARANSSSRYDRPEFDPVLALSRDGRRLVAVVRAPRAGGSQASMLIWTRAPSAAEDPPSPFTGPDTLPLLFSDPLTSQTEFKSLTLSPDGNWAAAKNGEGPVVAVRLPTRGRKSSDAVTSRVWKSPVEGNTVRLLVSDSGVVMISQDPWGSETRGFPHIVHRFEAGQEKATRLWADVDVQTPELRSGLRWSQIGMNAGTVTFGLHSGAVIVAKLTSDSSTTRAPTGSVVGIIEGMASKRFVEGEARGAFLDQMADRLYGSRVDGTNVSPDAQFVARTIERTTMIWRLPSAPVEIQTHPPHLTSFIHSLRSALFVAGGRAFLVHAPDSAAQENPNDASWLLWYDRLSGATDTLLRGPEPVAVVVSPDSRWLVAFYKSTPQQKQSVVRWPVMQSAAGALLGPADTLLAPEIPKSQEPDWPEFTIDDHGDVRLIFRTDTGLNMWKLRPEGTPKHFAFAPQMSRERLGWTLSATDVDRGCLIVLAESRLRGWALADGTTRPDCTPPLGSPKTERYWSAQAGGGFLTLLGISGQVALWDYAAASPVVVLPPTNNITHHAATSADGWVYRLSTRRGATSLVVDSAEVGQALLTARSCRLVTAGITLSRWNAALAGFAPPRRCGRT